MIRMKLSIVIPCYNEAKDIARNVEIVKDYLKDKDFDYELILVNDGSKDNTKEVIESIPGIVPLSYEKNRGKGGAVKYGIENATGEYVLFMDADLSTDITAIEKVVALAPGYDLILGSRHAKNSVIKKKQPFLRVFIGGCCRFLVEMLFHTKFKDTQCGFKLIRTEAAKKIIEKQIINDFAFDVEYIFIAKLNDLSMCELGITWSDDRGSTVSPIKSSLKFFGDIFAIRRNKKKYYFDGISPKKEDEKGLIVLMALLLLGIIGTLIVFLFVFMI